ncbi:MAG: tetratricopeptide repeat protein [Treponemataceae bacterium]|nr:MAG: tetratricopeptide repeat protein [Treponemataceae bacterium]
MTKRTRFFSCVLCGLTLVSLPASAQTAIELYNQGIEQLETNDFFAASDSFHEAVRLNPVYGDAWFSLARATFEMGEYNLALQYLDTAQKYAQGKTDIQNLKGFIYIALGKLTDAEAVFRDVLARYPNDVVSRFGLAELNIFYGRVSNAESLYIDALKRDAANRRALLSLALVSRELGKTAAAEQYIQQALRYHSGDAEVHYLAAYLSALAGNLAEAERRALTAVQLQPNYDKAYEILALIYFREKRYQEALDVCDFRIGRNRSLISAWYLKALCLQNLGRNDEAVEVYDGALAIDPADEVMRSALELLAREYLGDKDPRRKKYAAYHLAKAEEARKAYLASNALYEYQQALRIDPLNTDAVTRYAKALLDGGYPLRYLLWADERIVGKTQIPVSLQDSIEGYKSIYSDTLGKAWNIDPFNLDKSRWKVMFFYSADGVQLIHEEAEKIAAHTAANLFLSNSLVNVTVSENGYGKGPGAFAAAFKEARERGQDFFAVTSFEENERELAFSATIYSARTGTESGKIRVFRTGNDRLASALRGFATEFLSKLSPRGKIIARTGNTVLIDMGKTDGVAQDSSFTIVKNGKLSAADTGFALKYSQDDVLGTVKVTKVDEEVSEGVISGTGFYDRVNAGDELVPFSADAPQEYAAGTAQSPPAQTKQNGGLFGLFRRNNAEQPREPAGRLLPDGRTQLKPPVLAEIITNIR